MNMPAKIAYSSETTKQFATFLHFSALFLTPRRRQPAGPNLLHDVVAERSDSGATANQERPNARAMCARVMRAREVVLCVYAHRAPMHSHPQGTHTSRFFYLYYYKMCAVLCAVPCVEVCAVGCVVNSPKTSCT